jgi:uncharacterized membrane protein
MSATTGIPGSVWGRGISTPWSCWDERAREKWGTKKTTEPGPPRWASTWGQLLIAILFTLISLPLIVIGAIVAAVVTAWTLLLPAFVAGLVIAIVSLIVAGL